MIIQICGAPGAGKQRLAEGILEANQGFDLQVDPVHTIEARYDLPVGMMMDYRTEMLVGLERVHMPLEMRGSSNIIMTHSIFDSVCNAMLRTRDLSASMLPVAMVWAGVVESLSWIAQQSMGYDIFLRLPGYEEDDLDWNGRINKMIDELIVEAVPECIELRGTLAQNVQTVSNIIDNYGKEEDEATASE